MFFQKKFFVFIILMTAILPSALLWFEKNYCFAREPVVVSRVDPKLAGNRVSLTFDDGPCPRTTPKLLSILRAHNARATFFLVGTEIKKYPGLVKEIIDSKCEAAIHTYNHPDLKLLSFKNISLSMHLTSKELKKISEQEYMLMRPPYSSTDSLINGYLGKLGYKIILWSVSPADYEGHPPEEITRRALSSIKGGDIVVMHDKHENTFLALPQILEGLKKYGLVSVTVSELLNR